MDTTKEIRIGIRELRGNLSKYLKEANQGTAVLVTSRDVVIAELRAPSPKLLPPRRPGALKGRIQMADDFDTLPDDILDAMESWEP